MAFTPNMSVEEAHEEDRKRGQQMATKGVDTPEGAGLEGQEEGDDLEGEEEEEDLSASITAGSCPQNYGNAEMNDAKKALEQMTDKLRKYFKIAESAEDEDTEKALSTRSMHIPRPAQPYDPFNIQQSATKATTRGHSKLRGPEGVAPLVGETFAQLAEDEKPRTDGVVYKSCVVHGLSYRSDAGCYPCKLISKSLCKCGSQMFKAPGGGMSCPTCG